MSNLRDQLSLLYSYVREFDCGYILIGSGKADKNPGKLGLISPNGQMVFDVSYDEVIYTGLNCKYPVLYLRRFNGAPEFSHYIDLRKNQILPITISVDKAQHDIEITPLSNSPYIQVTEQVNDIDGYHQYVTLWDLQGNLLLSEDDAEIGDGLEGDIIIAKRMQNKNTLDIKIMDIDLKERKTLEVKHIKVSKAFYIIVDTKSITKILDYNLNTIRKGKSIKMSAVELDLSRCVLVMGTGRTIDCIIDNYTHKDIKRHFIGNVSKKGSIILLDTRTNTEMELVTIYSNGITHYEVTHTKHNGVSL